MVSTSDLSRLNAAVLELYAPGLDTGSFVPRAFAFIARLLPTDLSGYGALHTATKQLDASFDRHPTGLVNSFQAYGALMHRYAPFRFDPTFNDGIPWSARDFFSRAQFRDLDIYQEVHAPLGFDDHCFVHVPTSPELTLFFGLFRGAGVFRASEKQLLDLARHHLANARRLAAAHSATVEIPLSPALFATAGFTPRESETLYWLTQGKSNAEIAKLLRVRPDTVGDYLGRIFQKLGVENRVAATVAALTLARRSARPTGPVFFQVPTKR